MLLSVLPVFIVWQAAADAGWNSPAAWAAGLFARVLTLGYLVTGSLLAAALGHVLLHIVGITAGIQLPPHARVRAAGA